MTSKATDIKHAGVEHVMREIESIFDAAISESVAPNRQARVFSDFKRFFELKLRVRLIEILHSLPTKASLEERMLEALVRSNAEELGRVEVPNYDDIFEEAMSVVRDRVATREDEVQLRPHEGKITNLK